MEKMKNAKGMRNIIIHQYSDIDYHVVFEAISSRLIGDIKEFILSVE